MENTKYTLELDCFSGRQNPVLKISEKDFTTLYQEIFKLEKTTPHSLFDGLGFRGFILSDAVSIFLFIQKDIIKIELNRGVHYKKCNRDVLSKLISLAKKYDKENIYTAVIEKITDEYL